MNKELLTAQAATVIVALSNLSPGDLPHTNADKAHIVTILNIVLSVVGALTLLMITVSGFRYVTSAGNEQKAAKAKSGLTYALVGLVVAIMAESIVIFVEKRLT
jgi:hypothetical protein